MFQAILSKEKKLQKGIYKIKIIWYINGDRRAIWQNLIIIIC